MSKLAEIEEETFRNATNQNKKARMGSLGFPISSLMVLLS